tara:strand:+ start:16119 stop:16784 length:666 start_codon:yes stop_codon:yes gene_type:complete
MESLNEEEIKALAVQLSCPQGEMGTVVAERMHTNNRQMTWNTIKSLDLKNNDTVLEIGPGAAAHVPSVLNTAKNISYHGLDISELMVQEAQKINAGNISKKSAFFHLYDGTHIPLPDALFDKVMTVNTIYFWEHPDKLLKEIKRVMKPEAVFCICFGKKKFMEQLPFTKYGFKLYSSEKAQELITNAGFKILKATDVSDQVKVNEDKTMERFFSILTVQKT